MIIPPFLLSARLRDTGKHGQINMSNVENIWKWTISAKRKIWKYPLEKTSLFHKEKNTVISLFTSGSTGLKKSLYWAHRSHWLDSFELSVGPFDICWLAVVVKFREYIRPAYVVASFDLSGFQIYKNRHHTLIELANTASLFFYSIQVSISEQYGVPEVWKFKAQFII